MTTQARPLNFIDHGKVKLSTERHFPHVANQQIVPLIVHEFSKAAAEMPVVFVKNAETGEFQPVAILGFEAGENVFYGKPAWRGNYVPAVVMHYPLALLPVEGDEDALQVMLLEDEDVLAQTEGEALFDEKGAETKYLEQRKNAIGSYYEHMQITKDFVRALIEKELLKEQQLSIQLDDAKHNLSGLYIVDEAKLKELPDEDFLAFRSRGYFSPIYAHLQSLHQLNQLARLKKQPKAS